MVKGVQVNYNEATRFEDLEKDIFKTQQVNQLERPKNEKVEIENIVLNVDAQKKVGIELAPEQTDNQGRFVYVKELSKWTRTSGYADNNFSSFPQHYLVNTAYPQLLNKRSFFLGDFL